MAYLKPFVFLYKNIKYKIQKSILKLNYHGFLYKIQKSLRVILIVIKRCFLIRGNNYFSYRG